MKNFIKIVIVLIIFTGCTRRDVDNMVFLTTVYNIDWPQESNLSEKELKKSLNNLVRKLKRNKVNTIIFQVRPHAATFYHSRYEPASSFLSTSDEVFDVLEYMTIICKKRKLKLYAWINPFRVSIGNDDAHLAEPFLKKTPTWLFKKEKGYYLNPGIPAVRQYVVNIVREVVENYEVDALLFDDYFYPEESNSFKINDRAAFLTHNDSKQTVEDWRRENVTSLIKACHFRCKENGVKFVVSPVGIWRNSKDDITGTNSDGLSAYDHLYADTKLWCEKGYVDMILPQLYYTFGQESADFAEIAYWWNENRGEAELGFALAAYKVSNKSWGKRELEKQIKYIKRELNCKNIAFYNTGAYLVVY